MRWWLLLRYHGSLRVKQMIFGSNNRTKTKGMNHEWFRMHCRLLNGLVRSECGSLTQVLRSDCHLMLPLNFIHFLSLPLNFVVCGRRSIKRNASICNKKLDKLMEECLEHFILLQFSLVCSVVQSESLTNSTYTLLLLHFLWSTFLLVGNFVIFLLFVTFESRLCDLIRRKVSKMLRKS